MKKWFWIVVFCLTVTAFPACIFGGRVMSDSYEDAFFYLSGEFDYAAADVREVRVNWYSGSVILQQSSEDRLHVRESGVDLPQEKSMHWLLKDGVLFVEYCESGYSGTFSGMDKKLTVEVPENLLISVHTTSAGIAADVGKQREVYLQTASGTIEAGKMTATGKIQLVAASGGIRADSLNGEEITATTASGSVRIGEITAKDEVRLQSTSGGVRVDSLCAVDGEAEVGCISGSVRVGSLRAGTFSATTVSGDATVGAYECNRIDITTTSGSVRLDLGQSFGATATVRTTTGSFNGRGYHSENGRYVWGDGSCAVQIQTTSGSVTIQ